MLTLEGPCFYAMMCAGLVLIALGGRELIRLSAALIVERQRSQAQREEHETYTELDEDETQLEWDDVLAQGGEATIEEIDP